MKNAEELSKLVKTALAADKLSGLSDMMGGIAESVNAPIAILWQVAPEPVKDTLFILAEWFKEQQQTPNDYHTMPLSKAPTIKLAIESGVALAKITKDSPCSAFIRHFGIYSLFAIPLAVDKNKSYALSLYWTTDNPLDPDENDRDMKKAECFAGLLYSLYESIANKISYDLINQINRLLQNIDSNTNDFKPIAKNICTAIADTLQVHEVTLYLCGSFDDNNFMLQATTLDESTILSSQQIGNNTSLTSWVLTHKKIIRIFDLITYGNYREDYQSYYPDLQWQKTRILGDKANEIEKIFPNNNKGPLSFIAIPIIHDDKLLGVIRCCTALNAPYYFSEQKQQLLTLVANQIAQAWNSRLIHKRVEEENKSLDSFVKNLAKLNDLVLEKISDNRLQKNTFIKTLRDEVFKNALSSIHDSINNVEISAIRLVDKVNNCLYFAAVYGTIETSEDKFDLDETNEHGEPVKAGVWVVKNKKTLFIDNDQHRYASPLRRFKAESMILSPIKVADEVIGVIDVRNTTKNMFAPYTIPVIELIGLQLGLYSYLLDTVANLDNEKKQQTQTYEDFVHQLKSPIHQLRTRACNCVEEYKNIEDVPKQLLYLRGLSSKALRVTQSIRLFADLTKDRPIKLDKKLLTEDALKKMLIEHAIDQKHTIDPARNIKFNVNTDTLNIKLARVYVDGDLLTHAISNLLDNAAKYSFDDTTVEIYYGLTGKNNFHITVKNRGLALHETEQCKLRGWRGDEGGLVIGEGSGIGLWIVDNIMKAHQGNLVVVRTVKSITEVKLIFPVMV